MSLSDVLSGKPRLVAGLFAAIFVAQAFHGLSVKSGTCDELGAHLPAGILHWRSGTFSGGLANPPLGQLLVAAGSVLCGTADHPLRDDPAHLLPARLPVLILGLGTILLVAAVARRFAGPTAGLAALGAAALSPNLIAHSRLATLDLPVTAFFTLACVAAWRVARTGGRVELAVWGLVVGSACMIKLTALHLIPAVALGALLDGRSLRERVRTAGLLAAAAVAGIVLTSWLAYGFGDARGPLPEAYASAVSDKWEHGSRGHFSYLAGRTSRTGFPHYFLVALLVKVPIPLLLASVWGLVAVVWRRGSAEHPSSSSGNARSSAEDVSSFAARDARGFFAFVAVPALWVFLAMSLVHRVDIGVRHVLPVFAPLLALAGAGFASLVHGSRAGRAVAIVLGAWLLVEAARITPDHLAYFNQFAGGPARGDRILIDSNLDWGQDERRFRTWARGTDVVVNPDVPVLGQVAANVNAIRGILSRNDRRLHWLSRLEPERTFGHTWKVFRVREQDLRSAATREPAAAIDYARFLLGSGRVDEAAALLRRNDLSAHASLGAYWSRVRAEVALARGDLATAARTVPASGDADLAAEIAFRVSEERRTPWSARDRRERERTLPALWRRGRVHDARELLARLRAEGHPAASVWDADAPLSPDAGRDERYRRASLLEELGREESALVAVGDLLARHPTDEDALWLYGELVVRRKLGLSEYPMPDVDWSGLRSFRR